AVPVVLQGRFVNAQPHQRCRAPMPGDERQHDRCLVIGIEVRPVHGNLDTLPCAQHVSSRVTPFIHEASRNIRIFSVSCRSVMNFARESFFAGPMRNSGSVWRRAFATTNSDGGTPGRMVRSQEPNESQTSLGATTARYWSSPWATTPACMKA